MRYLPDNLLETVTVSVKVRGTRNTFTTRSSSIRMAIQPMGGGLRYGDMNFLKQNLYHGTPLTPIPNIASGDKITRADGEELTVLRVDAFDGEQELSLNDGRSTVR